MGVGRRRRGEAAYRVGTVAFSPDGAVMATAGNDRTIRLRDVAGGASWHDGTVRFFRSR